MKLRVFVSLFLCLSLAAGLTANAATQDKCAACHKTGVPAMTPQFHSKHLGMNMNCQSCHTVQEGVLIVERTGKDPLKLSEDDQDVLIDVFSAEKEKSAARRHLTAGLNCQACHPEGVQADARLPNTQCESCHGSQSEIAKKTGGDNPKNPHQSHQGAIDCALCHKGHQKAESYCLSCHQGFEQAMPESKLK